MKLKTKVSIFLTSPPCAGPMIGPMTSHCSSLFPCSSLTVAVFSALPPGGGPPNSSSPRPACGGRASSEAAGKRAILVFPSSSGCLSVNSSHACSRVDGLTLVSSLSTSTPSAPSAPSAFAASLSAALSAAGVWFGVGRRCLGWCGTWGVAGGRLGSHSLPSPALADAPGSANSCADTGQERAPSKVGLSSTIGTGQCFLTFWKVKRVTREGAPKWPKFNMG